MMEATPDPLITLSTQEQATIRARLHHGTMTPRVRERLEMVKAADLGADVPAIAVWSGRSERTVRHWLRRFLDEGITGLSDAPRSGRPCQADAAYLITLEQMVETAPRTLELPFDVWTSARLSVYLAQQTGVRISPGWLRVLLVRQQFACGRPKHTLTHLQEAAAVARCAAELAAVEKKGGRCTGTLRTASSG
jgi:transposase